MAEQPSFMGANGERLEYVRGSVVALAFWLYGYNQAVVGGFLSLESWARQFPLLDTVFTEGHLKSQHYTLVGVVIASFTMGAIISALTCPLYGNKLGKIRTIKLATFLTLIGEVLQCSSVHLPQFIVGRVILGAGVGILSIEVPNWQSECSDPKKRGRNVVISGLFIASGFMSAAWINYGFFHLKADSLDWRLPLVVPTLVSTILLIILHFQPESPIWLLRNHQPDKATFVLAALNGHTLDSEDIKTEIKSLANSLEPKIGSLKFRDILSNRRGMLRNRFLLCFFLQFCQQMCGSNLISVYATHIFQENLGLDADVAHILCGGALTWKLGSCFVPFFTIDRFGRRPLFMLSGAGMAACMVGLCVATSFDTNNKSAAAAAVCFMFTYNFFLPIGFLGANFLYCSEVAPSSLRLAMTSISTANHWLWNLIIVLVTPNAIDSIGYRYYILFIIINSCIPIGVFFFYPETNGRSLVQLEQVFESNSSIFKVVKASKEMPTTGQLYLEADVESRDEGNIEEAGKEKGEANEVETASQ